MPQQTQITPVNLNDQTGAKVVSLYSPKLYALGTNILLHEQLASTSFEETSQFTGIVKSITTNSVEALDFGYERLISRSARGIPPKNIGQAMVLHALLDPHIDLISKNESKIAPLKVNL
jgi:predicted ribonuclease YlaK